jgi:hypothetical protein
MSEAKPSSRRLISALGWSVLAPLALTGCAASPAKPPAAAPVVNAAPAKPPVSSGDSVDALVLGPNGKFTPIREQEIAAVAQATDVFSAKVNAAMRQRQQARLDNQRQPPREPAPVAAEPTPRSRPDSVARANAVVDLHDAHLAYTAPTPVANVADDGTRVQMTSVRPGGSVGKVVAPSVVPGGIADPLQFLTQTFSERVGANPRDAASQFDLQLARFLRESMGDPASDASRTRAELSALPDEDREMIAAVVDGVANFRAVYRNERNPLATQKAAPILEMADRIRSRTDLSVGSMSLCSAVRAYGNYDPVEPLKFRSGVANTVVFYCEVDGFQSLLDEQGKWTTKLSLELRLFTATDAGLQVWDAKPESVTDTSRKRRRDFFINKKIALPATLKEGRYILKATVKDLQAKRVAEQHIEITLEAR